jgi:hypothetical protein
MEDTPCVFGESITLLYGGIPRGVPRLTRQDKLGRVHLPRPSPPEEAPVTVSPAPPLEHPRVNTRARWQ